MNALDHARIADRTLCGVTILLAFCLSLWPMVMPAHAGFSESPTNYAAAKADLYVCNVNAGTVTVSDSRTGVKKTTISLPAGARPFGIAATPDYKTIYVTDNANPKLYLLRGGKLLGAIDTPAANSGAIAIHPQRPLAYITGSLGVMVLDTARNVVIKVVKVDYATSIVFSPDGTRAYVSCDGSYGSVSQIKVFDTISHTVRQTIQLLVPTGPNGIAMTPDGRRLYVACWVGSKVVVIDTEPASASYNRQIASIGVYGSARSIALNPTGNLAYVALDSGGMDVIVTNPTSYLYHQVLTHVSQAGPGGGVHEVASSLDGRFAFVAAGIQGYDQVSVVDTDFFSSSFNTVRSTFKVGNTPLGMVLVPQN